MVNAAGRLRALALTLAVPSLLGLTATAAHAEGEGGAIQISFNQGVAAVTTTDARATDDVVLNIKVTKTQLTVTSNTSISAPRDLCSVSGRTAKCKNNFYASVALGAGDDSVTVGGDGAVNLNTGAGNDTVTSTNVYFTGFGGEGNDVLSASSRYIAGVVLDGGAGDDTLLAKGNEIATLYGGIGNDTLIGGNGDDRLDAGDGDDVLLGGTGWDNLFGGSGSDSLDGGAGPDRIVGDGASSSNRLPGVDHVYYAKVKGAWSVTQEGAANDGSTADRDYEDDAHEQVRFDNVTLVEEVTKGAMPR